MQGRVQIPVKRNRRQQCRIREVPQKNELDENWQSSWNTNRQSCVQWLRWQSCASSASVNGYAGSANCVAPSGTGLMRPKTCRRSNRQLRKKPSTWKMNLLSESTTTSSSSFSSLHCSGLAANCRYPLNSRRQPTVRWLGESVQNGTSGCQLQLWPTMRSRSTQHLRNSETVDPLSSSSSWSSRARATG